MTTALAKIENEMTALGQVQRDTLAAIQRADEQHDEFSKALAYAVGLKELRDALTADTVGAISALAGTPIGFRTDKDKPQGGTSYSADTMRDCVIVALLRGLSLCGNQFNIISGQCYITKEGWSALLKRVPSLCDLESHVGMPEVSKQNGSILLVSARASAVVDGRTIKVAAEQIGNFDGRLAVTAYKGDIDQARGKAKARILRMLYERITDSEIGQPEDGVEVRVLPANDKPAIESDKWAVWRAEFKDSSERCREMAVLVMRLGDAESIRGVYADALGLMQAGSFTQRDLDRLKRLCQFAEGELSV